MKFKNIFGKGEKVKNNVSGEGLIDTGDNYLVCLCDKDDKIVSIASYDWNRKKGNSVALPINRFVDEQGASKCVDLIKKVVFNKVKDDKEREEIIELAKQEFRVGLKNMYFVMYDEVIANIDNGDYSLEVICVDKNFTTKEGANIKELYIGQGRIDIGGKNANDALVIIDSVFDYQARLERKLSIIGQDLSGLEYCIALSGHGGMPLVSFLCEDKVAIHKDGSAVLKIKKFKTYKDASDCADILEREILYNPENKDEIMKDVDAQIKDKYGVYLGSFYSTLNDKIVKRVFDKGHNLAILITNKDGNLINTNKDGSRSYTDIETLYRGGGRILEGKNHIMVEAFCVPGGEDAMKMFEKMEKKDPEVIEKSYIIIKM